MGYPINKEKLRGWMDAGLSQLGVSPERLAAMKSEAMRGNNSTGFVMGAALKKFSTQRAYQLWQLMKLYYTTPTGGQVDSEDIAKIGFDVSFLDKDKSPAAWDAAYKSFQWADTPAGAPPPVPASTNAGGEQNPPEQPSTDKILQEIQAEFERLRGAPTKDPVFQSLLNAGRSAGQQAAGAAGVSSREGLGLRGVAGAATQATTPYLQQRQQLAQGYLQLGNQRDMGLADLSLRRDAMSLQAQQFQDQMGLQAQALQNQVALQNWQNQTAGGQGLGGLLGAGIGALGYAIPGIGAALGPVTMQMGAGLGGAIGGMVGGGSAPSLQSYAPRGNYTLPGGGYRGGWS